jgi:hypothetical protein
MLATLFTVMVLSVGDPLPPKVPIATGANVNERGAVTVVVDPRGRAGAAKTLKEGFSRAVALLNQGRTTRLRLMPGTYREAVTNVDWTQGKLRDTPLIIEGGGKTPEQVRWTGADVFPRRLWRSEGSGILSAAWPYKFGQFGYQWTAAGQLAHRRELAFAGETPLMPRILEPTKVIGADQSPDSGQVVTYEVLPARDPKKVLKPGEFGVMERLPGGARVMIHPPAGFTGDFELSTRRSLLDLSGKNNVVLRNLTFERVANDESEYSRRNAVHFDVGARASRNVLIDRCRFIWSASTGLHVNGFDWTIRNSVFNYHGVCGIGSGKSENVVFDGVETSYNVWRAWRAGEILYYTGGVKMHEVRRHLVRNHKALANCTAGLWWDIFCYDVVVDGATLVDNSCNLQFELSPGPFIGRRILSARSRGDDGILHFWMGGSVLLENCLLWNDTPGSGNSALLGVRWFNRDDSHASMGRLEWNPMFVRNSVFAAGPQIKLYTQLDDQRPLAKPGFRPFQYFGTDNVFFHPNDRQFADRWGDDVGQPARQNLKAAEWFAQGHRKEVRPRSFDPLLRDPAGGDFRFAEASPLFARRTEWPQIRLSEQDKATTNAFVKWSGFTVNGWGPLPEP